MKHLLVALFSILVILSDGERTKPFFLPEANGVIIQGEYMYFVNFQNGETTECGKAFLNQVLWMTFDPEKRM